MATGDLMIASVVFIKPFACCRQHNRNETYSVTLLPFIFVVIAFEAVPVLVMVIIMRIGTTVDITIITIITATIYHYCHHYYYRCYYYRPFCNLDNILP